MISWKASYGVSKMAWEVMSESAKEVIVKRLEGNTGSRKGGRSQKEGQAIASLINEKTKKRNERLIQEALEKQRKKETAEIKADERVVTIGSRKGGRSQKKGQVVGNRIKFLKFKEKNKLKK
tara:strand:- start:122 stop:487 length:366 start_codon:yes stop_codon:yes gene_type:complete